MTNKANIKSLHIRHGGTNTHLGTWQAWDGENYLSGANGPMALFTMGCFLDAIDAATYHQPGKESNPSQKWMLP